MSTATPSGTAMNSPSGLVRYASPTRAPAPNTRHIRARAWWSAAEITSQSALTTSSVYSASDPAPRFTRVVDSPGPRAATQAVAMPATGPAIRRPSSAKGRMRAVLDRHVNTTVPVWGSDVTRLRESEQERHERREVQLGLTLALIAVALDQRDTRAQVGGLVGGGRVVGQADGNPEGESDEQGRHDHEHEPRPPRRGGARSDATDRRRRRRRRGVARGCDGGGHVPPLR